MRSNYTKCTYLYANADGSKGYKESANNTTLISDSEIIQSIDTNGSSNYITVAKTGYYLYIESDKYSLAQHTAGEQLSQYVVADYAWSLTYLGTTNPFA